MEFKEKHFYLTAQRQSSSKDRIIECGTSEENVYNTLDLLNNVARQSRKTIVKGIFIFENGKKVKCEFKIKDGRIQSIDKILQ